MTLRVRTLAWILVGLSAFLVMVGGGNAGGDAAHLGGAGLGFVLVRFSGLLDFTQRLRFGGSGRWRRLQQQRQRRRLERQNRVVLAEEAEVDRILAKVKEHGLHSLTSGEKKTLQRATERQRRAG
jgi:hypothetical protein